jgi:hypothetical protein
MRWLNDSDDDDEACLIKTIKVYRNSGIQIEDHKCRAARILALALRRVARSMPRRERQILVLVRVDTFLSMAASMRDDGARACSSRVTKRAAYGCASRGFTTPPGCPVLFQSLAIV